MRKVSSDVFNVLIPASKVSRAIESVNKILNTDNIEEKIEKNILKAELYCFNYAETTKPIDIKFIKNISKTLFMDSYSWAGKIQSNSRKIQRQLNNMINNLVEMWEDVIKDEDLKIWALAYSYYTIVSTKPFFDGNELVARVFMNFIAIKLGLPIIKLKPKKGTPDYKKYIFLEA